MPFSLGKMILKYNRLGFLLTLLIVIGGGFGATKLGFTNNYRIFFSDDNPQLLDFDRFQDIYGDQDNILIAVEAKNGDIFSKDILSTINKYTIKAWDTPYSTRVDSLTNYQHTFVQEDDLIVESLVEDSGELTDERINEIRNIVTGDPILTGMLISKKGHVSAINITINLPPDAGKEEAEAIAYARSLAENMMLENPNINTYISGQAVLNSAFMEAALVDGVTLIPFMLLLILLVSYFFLRSFWGAIGTLTVVMLSIVAAFGGAGYLGITLTNTTGMVPIIILTIGVADSIHLLITYYQGIANNKSKYNAMLEALRINMQPIFLTSITTIIGFLSLNFGEIPPFRDMGNMVAMGAAAAWFMSVVTLPIFMMVLPVPKKIATHSFGQKIMSGLYGFVEKNSKVLLVSFIISLCALGSCIPRISFNDLSPEYFDKSIQFRSDNDFIVDNLTGVMALQYSVSADEKRGIYNPDYLNQLDALGEWFEQQGAVLYVNNITTILKRLNKNLHNDDDQYYRIPNDRESAAQYMFLYELSLPYGLDMTNSMDIDRSASRLTVIIKNTKSVDIIKLDQDARKWLEVNGPNLTVSNAVGPSIMFSHISERNLWSMLEGLGLAVILISGVLLVALRDIRLGLLSIIPNISPAILAYGIWSIVVGELGMAGVTVTVISLGIIVDNTVHFLSKYLRAKNELNKNVGEAIDYAFSSVGVALGVTTCILVLGFVVLGFSKFHPNTVLGQLTALSLFISLMVTYFFLPPLLFLVDRDSSGGKEVKKGMFHGG